MAYAVFHAAEVDSRLASYGGIYHCQQRRGDIDITYAAFVSCRHKSAEVGHTSAAEVYQYRVAVVLCLHECLPHL